MTEIRKAMPWSALPHSQPSWLRDIRVPSRKRPNEKQDVHRDENQDASVDRGPEDT